MRSGRSVYAVPSSGEWIAGRTWCRFEAHSTIWTSSTSSTRGRSSGVRSAADADEVEQSTHQAVGVAAAGFELDCQDGGLRIVGPTVGGPPVREQPDSVPGDLLNA